MPRRKKPQRHEGSNQAHRIAGCLGGNRYRPQGTIAKMDLTLINVLRAIQP